MARSNSNTSSSSSTKRAPKENSRSKGKKQTPFPKDDVYIDYKDPNLLRRFLSDRGKIRARRVTGASSQRQRELAVAIKTARELALLPYSQRTTTERAGGGRGPRPDRGDRKPRDEETTPAAEQLGVDTDADLSTGMADGDITADRAVEEMQ